MISMPHETPQARAGAHLFRHLQPDLVLDIGANVGESMRWFREIWPGVPVYCFEPRKAAYEKLSAGLAEGCKAYHHCLGDAPGWTEINVFLESDGAGGGSSLLHPTELMKQTRAWSNRSIVERVEVFCLDDIHEIADFERLFVKIDVQGYEGRVIRGGLQTFAQHVIGAFVEVEEEPLYEGASNLAEIDGLMKGCGLARVGAAHKVHRGDVFSWADWVWLR